MESCNIIKFEITISSFPTGRPFVTGGARREEVANETSAKNGLEDEREHNELT